MIDNIDRILEKGEKLELLVDKTDRLNQQAFKFEKSVSNVFWVCPNSCSNLTTSIVIRVVKNIETHYVLAQYSKLYHCVSSGWGKFF